MQPALRCLCASIHGSPREARSAGTGIRRALWHIHSGKLHALLGKPRKISSVFNKSCFHLPASIHPKHLPCALCKRMRAPSHSFHDLSGAGIFWDKRRSSLDHVLMQFSWQLTYSYGIYSRRNLSSLRTKRKIPYFHLLVQ